MTTAEPRGRRKNNKPWKHIYGVDRRYTARVDRLRDRMIVSTVDSIVERYGGALDALGSDGVLYEVRDGDLVRVDPS